MRWKRRRSPAQARTGDNEDEEKAITSFRVHFFKGGAIFLLSYCLVMSSVSSSAQSTHKCCVVGLMCVCVFVCGKPTELVCETSCVCGTMRMWWRGRCREDTLWLTPLGAALECASGESPDWQFSVFRLCWTLLTAAIGVSFSPLSVLFWNLSRVFVPFTFCLWHTCTYTSKFSDSWSIVRWSFLFTQAFHDLILTVFLVFHFCFHDCPLHAFFAMLPYHLLIIHLDIVLFLFSASMCVLHLSPLCLVTVDIHKACM